jgi:hypothetical protein
VNVWVRAGWYLSHACTNDTHLHSETGFVCTGSGNIPILYEIKPQFYSYVSDKIMTQSNKEQSSYIVL